MRDLLVGVQRDVDRLQALHARIVAEFESRDGHRADGCASMAAWLRRKLRLSGSETRARRRAAAALMDLPEVKAAVEAGRIRPAHVDVFATGVRRLGATVMRSHQHVLLPVAETCDPADLLTALDRLRDTVDPDAADRDWVHAQEKYDVNLRRVVHGFDLSGYLDPETGVKLKQVIDSVSAPECSEDQRPVAQRRVEGLNRLVSAILDSGLPSDKGVRPHLAETVGLDTLQKAVRGDRTASAPPTFLAGYGLIGRDLLSSLACDATLSVVLTETSDAVGRSPYKHVLDIGRAERLADPAAAARDADPARLPLRRTRLRQHLPRDPPHRLVARRRSDRHGQPGGAVRRLPPPRPRRSAPLPRSTGDDERSSSSNAVSILRPPHALNVGG